MITIRKAIEITSDYLGEGFVIVEITDIGDAFVLHFENKERPGETMIGALPVCIDKSTGSIEPFLVTNRENFERLRKGVEIPQKQWAK